MTSPVGITFLGGLGRIGRNCAVLEVEGRLLLVDCGQLFPDDIEPGVDVILPDFTYLRERAGDIEGCLLTHAHEDHIGALPYALRDLSFPVYGMPFTLGLVRHKLAEAGLLDRTELIPIADHERRRIGPFDCEFLPVAHSTPSSLLTIIRTPQGVVIHSGDFKLDETPVDGRVTDLRRVAEVGRTEGVRLLLADSTNADSPGSTRSEAAIRETLRQVFEDNRGRRLIVASFASHVHRMQLVADLAVAEGRRVCMLGTSMVRNLKLARDLGLMHIPDASIVEPDELGRLDPGEVCVLCTGSQGEHRAALWQMAAGESRYLSLGEDDTVVLSAHPIPGNEAGVARLRNRLSDLGAVVVHDGILEVHTSGHAKQDELAALLRAAQPECFVPVHGESMHLAAHARLARDVLGLRDDAIVVCHDGDTLLLDEQGVHLGASVPHGWVYVDGTVGGVDDNTLRERTILGADGFVVVSVDVDLDERTVRWGPEIVSKGWAADAEREWLHAVVATAVHDALEAWFERGNRNGEPLTREDAERIVRRATGSTVADRTRRRPMIVPVVSV